MKLKIYTKHHYGNDYQYLENRKKRMAFKRLTGRKTITETDLRDLEKVLDLEIEFELIPYIRKSKNPCEGVCEQCENSLDCFTEK